MSGRSLPKVLTQAEQERFLNQFRETSFYPLRNKVTALLMLNCGLRISEVINLKPEHINYEEQKIIVRDGKGGKDRIVYFGDELERLLKKFSERRPEDSEWFVCNSDGGQAYRVSIWRVIKRAARRTDGIQESEKVSPHTLRHTFATRLYESCGDLRIVQDVLGHANLATTEIYTHVSDRRMKDAMRRMQRGEGIV